MQQKNSTNYPQQKQVKAADLSKIDQDLIIKRNLTDGYKFNAYERMWRLLFIVALVFGLLLLQKSYRFQTSPAIAHVQKLSPRDLFPAIGVAIVQAIIRWVVLKVFKGPMINFMPKSEVDQEAETEKRAKEMCKWLYDMFLYTSTTIASYLIVWQSPYHPEYLGGPENSCSNLFNDYPNVPHVPYMQEFVVFQCGVHLYAFFYQLFSKYGDVKFWEMFLHHFLALFLIIFSFEMNFLLIGFAVLMVHDPADIGLVGMRFYMRNKNQKKVVTAILCTISVVVWIFHRNYVFPMCCIKASFAELMKLRPDDLQVVVYWPIFFMTFMLVFLQILQIYWSYILLYTGYEMISGQKKKLK